MDAPPPPSPQASPQDSSQAGGMFREFVRLMVRHKNAANLLMISVLALGLYGMFTVNRQFFPTLEFDTIAVTIIWPGASAEDVDTNIVDPLQSVLRLVDGVRDFSARSTDSRASITLEFDSGWDMGKATTDVESAVDQLTTLPKDIERPIIRQFGVFEPVASILLTGPFEESTLLEEAKKIRDELLDRGIDKVDLIGARDQEIWVETRTEQIRRYNITPEQIASRIRQSLQDLPGGLLRGTRERQVRSKGLVKTAEEIGAIEVRTGAGGERVLVSDVARVYDSFDTDQPVVFKKGQPAIVIYAQRAGDTDSVKSLNTVVNYAEQAKAGLPQGLKMNVYELLAEKINQRIAVLVKNGIGGFILVGLILFLFLNLRVALWVAAGIPIALMMALGLFQPLGQTVNMLSLFGFIMMLGVIVDDAIVVGEHASTIYNRGGTTPQEAAELGAIRMARPIFAAALTTLVAFLPMLIIPGGFGQMSRPLPIIVSAVLIASLIECYLILPSHMAHALSFPQGQAKGFRRAFRERFNRFRMETFPPHVARAYDNRWAVVSIAVAFLIVIIGLFAGNRVQFSFFPAPEGERLEAFIRYQPGTPKVVTREGMLRVEEALYQTDEELRGQGDSLILESFTILGQAGSATGNNLASVRIELTASEDRDIRTDVFIERWQKNIPSIAGVRRIVVVEQEGGPPVGAPIEFTLTGESPVTLKQAAEELKEALALYPGVLSIRDSLKYGRQELLIEVNERGAALGFNNQNVGDQLRNAYEGAIARRFTRNDSEVTVRVLLPRDLKSQSLDDFYLLVPNSAPPRYIALPEVVSIEEQPGFASIRRGNAGREVSVSADYADHAGSPDVVMQDVNKKILPPLLAKYGLESTPSRRIEEMTDFFQGFAVGVLMALGLIYIILALVFASYTRPIVIMSIIPFGLIGAVLGHFVQGYDVNFLSLIALLGLSGILVNNSIILLSRIEELQGEGMVLRDAVVQGVTDRFRPVILTSMTTVFGLVPMLFETSVQSQYVIPIALTLAWGLATSGFLILFVLPALLGIQEDIRLRRVARAEARAKARGGAGAETQTEQKPAE